MREMQGDCAECDAGGMAAFAGMTIVVTDGGSADFERVARKNFKGIF